MTLVLVVDDSRFMRTIIGTALEGAGFDVEMASDGHEAVESAIELQPDVITMDVEMPGLGGIEAVERIMARQPAPILMLSAYTEPGAEATLDALERGAVDFLRKPDGSGDQNVADMAEAVVERVESLASAAVSEPALARATAQSTAERRPTRESTIPAGSGTAVEPVKPTSTVPVEPDALLEDPTVVVGASTGGPHVVEELLESLPAELEAKGIVVQHMPAAFTGRFAERLDGRCALTVREAADGDVVGPGEFVVAPGGHHLRVVENAGGRLRVEYDDSERVHGVRPAIDVTMESAATVVEDPIVGVVLSGMGRDGARGIEALAGAGGTTIAQDESTSPVFGMPRQAINTGAVDRVLAAPELPRGVVEAFTRSDVESSTGDGHG